MKKRLLTIVASVMISSFTIAQHVNEEKKYFSIEHFKTVLDEIGTCFDDETFFSACLKQEFSGKNLKNAPVLYEDRWYHDDKDFFNAWLTGQYTPTGVQWHNDCEQLKHVPAFLDSLQNANDRDIFTLIAEGIGPKSAWHDGKNRGNLVCNFLHRAGKNNDLIYVGELRISAKNAKQLAKSWTIKNIITGEGLCQDIKDHLAEQPYVQAIKKYIEKNK